MTDFRPHRRKALQILSRAKRWISGAELTRRLGLRDTRELRRHIIAPLRFQCSVPIHFRPGGGGGYKIRVTAKEHVCCLDHAKQMGRDFFAIASTLKRESLEVVFAQMVMDFLPHQNQSVKGNDALRTLVDSQARQGRRIKWTDVIPHLLQVMAEDPKTYAEDIAQIGQKFAGIFLSNTSRQEAQKHLQAATNILSGKVA